MSPGHSHIGRRRSYHPFPEVQVTPSPVPSPASQPCLLMHQENHTLEFLPSAMAQVPWLRAKSLACAVPAGTKRLGLSFPAVTLPVLSPGRENPHRHHLGSSPEPCDCWLPEVPLWTSVSVKPAGYGSRERSGICQSSSCAERWSSTLNHVCHSKEGITTHLLNESGKDLEDGGLQRWFSWLSTFGISLGAEFKPQDPCKKLSAFPVLRWRWLGPRVSPASQSRPLPG